MAPPKLTSSKKVNKGSRVNQAKKASKEDAISSLPLELQQLLLNIFKDSFPERLESDIKPLLQEVKSHLYNRDFAIAFGRNDYLEAYAARWSPSRALGYLQLFVDLKEHLSTALEELKSEEDGRAKIVCLGGGAGAEIVALGGLLHNLRFKESRDGKPLDLSIIAIDIANWSPVVERLSQNITIAPTLSKYASVAAQAATAPLVDAESFHVGFHQNDVLSADFSILSSLLAGATLVTIMFTLNELYSTSLSQTQRFLLNLTACLQKGALLLVVDSPGSYSAVSLNGTEKKYPMQWLLDHTLLNQSSKGEAAAWTKIEEDDARWFRLDPRLNYPIELENMRFQLHLFKRVG